MATNTWDPTSGTNASTDANWTLGHKPTTGEAVVFDGTDATTNCAWDYAVSDLGSLNIAVAYTGTITQNQAIGMTGTCTITGGTANGFNGNSKTITCRGWSSSANLTTLVSVVVFDGSGNIAHSGSTRYLSNTTINAGVTMTVTSGSAFGTGNSQTLSIAATGKMTINAAQTWLMNNCYAQIANSGTIDGAGSINFIISSTGTLGTTGTISCTTTLSTIAANNYVVTLGANTTFSGALNVNNSASTGTCTLSSGTKTLQVDGLVTLGNYGAISSGTAGVTFNGGLTINGTNALFTQGGNVDINGNVTNTAGTFTGAGGTTYWVTCSGNWIGTAGTKTADVLRLDLDGDGSQVFSTGTILFKDLSFSANITMQSDVYVGGTLTIDSSCTVTTNNGATTYTLYLVGNATNTATIANSGTIGGTGAFSILFQTTGDADIATLGTLGTISTATTITNLSTSNNRTVTMNISGTCGSTLTITGSASNTAILTASATITLGVTGLTTLSTRGVITQGTGAFTLTGGLTINGTNALFTQGGAITCTGNFALTSGTFTASAGIFTFNKTSLQTITGAPVFATMATSGSGTKVEGSFSATTVTTVAGTYIIATTWAGTANNYRIYVHTGESLNKSTITTDFSSSSNVTLKRGSFACNETAAANSIVIDSGTTFTNNAGITLTCCSITNNGTSINNGIISCGISYPSYIIDVTNMTDNAHMIDGTNWRRNILS